MTLKEISESLDGTVYRFTQRRGFSIPALYGILRRKRSVSKGMLAKLESVLGGDVPDLFDEDGVLIQK